MVFLPKDSVQGASFDLHVLSTPPAFILSQDQTLVKSVCSVRMTLAIHPLLLFWKSLASITRINNVRSENIFLNFQGWLLFNYQCSCLLSLCDSLFILSNRCSFVKHFFVFLNSVLSSLSCDSLFILSKCFSFVKNFFHNLFNQLISKQYYKVMSVNCNSQALQLNVSRESALI